MPVPSTINSVREQVREAVKLSIATVCTALPTSTAWNTITDAAKFPLAKAVYALSGLQQEYIGNRDMRTDTLYVEVAPYCTASDYELATSRILESYYPLFRTDLVRGYMDPSYAPKLGKISMGEVGMISTSLVNPYAVVRFTLTVQYALSA